MFEQRSDPECARMNVKKKSKICAGDFALVSCSPTLFLSDCRVLN